MLSNYCQHIIAALYIACYFSGSLYADQNNAAKAQNTYVKSATGKQNPKTKQPFQLPTKDIRTRKPYNHQGQPLPELIRRGSYTEENAHLPKSIEQAEYSRLLFIAVMQENIGAIKALLAKGANINALDANQKSSPLIYSVIHNKVRSLNYLILRGADLDVAAVDGKTALHFAVIKKNPTLINILIESGADSNIADQHNMHPLDYFTKQDLEQNPQLITKFMHNDLEESLIYATKRDISIAVLYFIQQGANVNTNGDDGFTPLLLAIRNQNKAMVSLLLNAGASLIVPIGERTVNAIDYARAGNDVEMLRILDTVKIRRELEANVQTMKYEAAPPPLPKIPPKDELPVALPEPTKQSSTLPKKVVAKPLAKLEQPAPAPIKKPEAAKPEAPKQPKAPPVYYRPGKAKVGQSGKSAAPVSIIPESVANQ